MIDPRNVQGPDGLGSPQEDRHLELHEERAVLSKDLRQAGAVRISKRTTIRIQMVPVQVQEEWAVIERIAGMGDDPIHVNEEELSENRPIKILLATEHVSISKERKVVEGIVIRKEMAEREETVTTSITSEELVVDDPTGRAIEEFSPIGDDPVPPYAGRAPAQPTRSEAYTDPEAPETQTNEAQTLDALS